MKRLYDLVASVARQTPDRPALAASDGQATYGELDALADAIARDLQAAGVGAGDRVGIWLIKSVHAVAAMQACWRLGAAYVPMDPLAPVARARQIAADAEVRVVVCPPERADDLDASTLALTVAEASWRDLLARAAPLPVRARPAPDDLAYILYTSGSTGRPKGVCITHRNAEAFVEWAVGALALRAEDRLANHAPLHFDLSVLDLYGAFAVGAFVSLIPEDVAKSPAGMVQQGRRERLSVWYSVPSALMLMMRRGGLFEVEDWEPRVVCFAGEVFPIADLRALRGHWPKARFFNLYGPTETNVCTAYEVGEVAPDRRHPVPIGRACSGASLWLESEDGRRSEDDEHGELVVEGPTVMQGYWGREPQAGPYRTGDWVHRNAQGELEFDGRRDEMVKLRGHRLELGEVEAALADHEDVAEVAVVVAGAGLDARLVAFVAPRGERMPSVLALKRQCASRLPSYMVVDQVVPIPALDRTPNGKIDRRALRERALLELPALPDSEHLLLDGLETSLLRMRMGAPVPRAFEGTLVCLPAVGDRAEHYSDLLRWLASRGIDACAVDPPGYGAQGDTALPSLARLRRSWARALAGAIAGPKLLVGNSVGGALATAAARDADVIGLVLVGWPTSLDAVPAPQTLMPTNGAELDDFLTRSWCRPPAFGPSARRLLLEQLGAPTLAAHANSLDGRGYLADLAAYRGPLWCVAGDCDGLVPAAALKASAAEHPRCELILVDDCGHYPHREQPAAFGAALASIASSVFAAKEAIHG